LLTPLLHALAQLLEAGHTGLGRLREHFSFLLIDVALHVLDEDVELGVELLVAGLHLHQFVHQLLSGVVFLFGALHHFTGAVSLATDGRVEDFFLEDRVNVEFDQCRFGRRLLSRLILCFFELAEELLHLSVILPQHLQCVHQAIPPRSRGTMRSMGRGVLQSRKLSAMRRLTTA
jgi:hypothetical protein